MNDLDVCHGCAHARDPLALVTEKDHHVDKSKTVIGTILDRANGMSAADAAALLDVWEWAKKTRAVGPLAPRPTSTRPSRVLAAGLMAIWPWPVASGVYFALVHDRVKIGCGRNVRVRLRDLQTASPYELDLVAVLKTSDLLHEEAKLHRCFARHRVHGEWFELRDDLLEFVRDLNRKQSAASRVGPT